LRCVTARWLRSSFYPASFARERRVLGLAQRRRSLDRRRAW
jgi:hypothetical protein